MSKLFNKRRSTVLGAAFAAVAMAAATFAVPAGAQARPSAGADVPQLGSCIDKTGVLVASDEQAQSDVLSAITLAEATDSCLILAGDRNDPNVSEEQLVRADASDGVAYIVGGPAAVSYAKQREAGAARAMRIGGANRYETARLVGAHLRDMDETVEDGMDEAEEADDTTDSEPAEVAATIDLGALTGDKSHTAPAGQTDVEATLARARWRITAQSQVPSGARDETSFAPTLLDGACFTASSGQGDRPERHRFVWDLKPGTADACEYAEDRSVSVSLSSGDLDDYRDDDLDADWGWTVSFTRLPAVNVPNAVSATATTRETLTPIVAVPKSGDMATRQIIRLGRGEWLLHVIDHAAGGLSGSDARDVGAAHRVIINDVPNVFKTDAYDNADAYDNDRYRCVEKASVAAIARWSTDTDIVNVVADAATGNKHILNDGTAVVPSATTDDGSLIVSVPANCGGHVAVEVANPAGTADDNGADDISRWRVQVIPLKAAS